MPAQSSPQMGPHVHLTPEEWECVQRHMPTGHANLVDEDKLIKSILKKIDRARASDPRFLKPHV